MDPAMDGLDRGAAQVPLPAQCVVSRRHCLGLLLAFAPKLRKSPRQAWSPVRRQTKRRRKPAHQANFHEHIPSQKKLIHEIMPLDRMQNRPKILFVTSHWSLAPAYVIVPSEQEARSTTFGDRACALLDCLPISPPTDTGGIGTV
jgi:hypothetical protein